jgi:hypothetical protein
VRDYWVKVGDSKQPTVRLGTGLELKIFLFGVFVGDGHHIDRADALAEGIADRLVRGGQYPDRKAAELADGRQIYAWQEGSE